jgi:hypothetical protein
VVPGIPIPAWFQSVTWADTSRERVWRAEEMELVTEPVVAVTGTMLTAIRSRMAVRTAPEQRFGSEWRSQGR